MKDELQLLPIVELKFWNSLKMIMAGCVKKILKSPYPGNNKEIRMMWMTKQSIVLALALLVSAGYSSVLPDYAQSAQDTNQNKQIKTAAIESISVSGDGATAELVIKLSSPATYTSYKTTSPLRLVVDLSQTTQGSISSPLEFNKGNFKAVTVSRYDTDAGILTRVDVELVNDADAVLSTSKENPGELKISFPALAVAPDKGNLLAP